MKKVFTLAILSVLFLFLGLLLVVYSLNPNGKINYYYFVSISSSCILIGCILLIATWRVKKKITPQQSASSTNSSTPHVSLLEKQTKLVDEWGTISKTRDKLKLLKFFGKTEEETLQS